MLNKIKFDDTEIIYPLTWNEQSNDVKETMQMEDGSDKEIIIRRDKLLVSCSFKCTDKWLKIFKEFKLKNDFRLTQYDAYTDAEESRIVRIENFTYGLVKDSWDLDSTKGIWQVSFDLEEF